MASTNHLVDEVKILVCTWNVGNKRPKASELEHWLPSKGGDCDIIVVGSQENSFANMRRKSTIVATEGDEDDDDDDDDLREQTSGLTPPSRASDVPSPSTPRIKRRSKNGGSNHGGNNRASIGADSAMHEWDHMCADRLGTDWEVVAHICLREMRLTVYCTSDLASTSVRHVATASAATGIAGVVGNKGGLVVRLDIGHTAIAFCSCHLAAHEGVNHHQSRNAMCKKVLQKTSGGKVASARSRRELDAAHAVDHIFWLGDLNYRIDLSLTGGSYESKAAHWRAVSDMVEAEKWEELMEADGLRAARRAGEAFHGFSEGEMAFAPTFKVQRQPGVAYKTQRTPSYCDRILWKSQAPLQAKLKQLSLASVPAVSTSDHKPVVSTFRVSQSPRITRTSDVQTTIRITNLRVCDILAADIDGTSDPFCRFYTHPEGLLKGARAPETSVKWFVQAGEQAGHTGTACCAGLHPHISRVRNTVGEAISLSSTSTQCDWKDSQTPTLYAHAPIEALRNAVLIIAVFDYNNFRRNEPLGVVSVPLAPQEGSVLRRSASSMMPSQLSVNHRSTADEDSKEGYAIRVLNAPICHGHSTAGTGHLHCTLHIERYEPPSGGLISRLIAGWQRRWHTKARSLENAGDYLGATVQLEKANDSIAAHDDVSDAELVRSQVVDLTRLAEMKWRYRVVEKGESPHDAAIETLERAKGLVERHRDCVLAAPRDGEAKTGSGGATKPMSAAQFRLAWGSEMAAVLHGMCVTRLIFGTWESDSSIVEERLQEAIALREGLGLRMELADSLNSLGTLKQKQKAYDDAARHFERSLQIRQSVSPKPSSNEAERAQEATAKQQAIAQSLVSLGNLAIERGDAAGDKAGDAAGESCEASACAKACYSEARGHLEASVTAYVRGFHETHPKVAWAHEGLGRLHEKEGNLDAALLAYDKAAQIRGALQSSNAAQGKELFAKELDALQCKRQQLREISESSTRVSPPAPASTGSEGGALGGGTVAAVDVAIRLSK